MRALNRCCLVAALSFAVGCGGESSSDNDPPEPGEQGGEGGAGPSGSGGNGEAGESPGSGGKATAGKAGVGGAMAAGGAASPGGVTGTGASGPVPGGAPPTMGGSPSKPPPPPPGGGPGNPSIPPEGCEVTGQTSSLNFCQQFLTCTNTQLVRECQEQGSGIWTCYCSNVGSTFELRGATGIAACEAIGTVCDGELPEDAGAEECSLVREGRGVNNCELLQQCSVPLDVDEPRVSRVTSGSYLNCVSDGLGSTCNCANGSYQIQGAASPAVCDLMLDVCSGPATSEGEETCTPFGQSAAGGYCSVQQQCSSSEEVADGVYAVRSEFRVAECFPSSAGKTQCLCSGDQKSNQFELHTSTPDLATCNIAASLCGSTDTLELTGPIECSQASQNAMAGYCNSTRDCTQSGTIDGVEITVHGYVQTNCAGSGDSWGCSCSSGSNIASTTVDLSGDPWDDCTAAAEACQDLVEVEIGVTGDPGGMRPLPSQ